MSNEDTQADKKEEESVELDEMTILKQRARQIGVEFSNNIGMDTLKQRIKDKLEGTKTEEVQETVAPPLEDPAQAGAPKAMTLREKLVKENMRMVRLRITNLDPKKKDLPGEIVTVANEYLGTVRKYIPFGEVTDDGYHVPYCLYKALKARKFLNIRTYKDRRNNNQTKVEQNWAQEFALEILPPLTKEEISKLAAAQSAAGGLD